METVNLSNPDARNIESGNIMGAAAEMDKFKHSVDELSIKVDKVSYC